MTTESLITKLSKHKTSDGEFMFGLILGYELSPEESETDVSVISKDEHR